jgi:hypothetical protein
MNMSFDLYPFRHWVIDDYLHPTLLNRLLSEVPPADDPRWVSYSNVVEKKKALADWHAFGPATYHFFTDMCGEQVGICSRLTGIEDLFPDYGLHGGGWHLHGDGGNLNPHLDYARHPKLSLARRLNAILYLTPDWQAEWGGHFGLWEKGDEPHLPGKLYKEILPVSNRFVMFETPDAWHGMSRPLHLPPGVYRRSLAMYYLSPATETTGSNKRALFAPREDQRTDKAVQDLCLARSK